MAAIRGPAATIPHGQFGAFFDTAAQIGVVLHDAGWILLGLELARSVSRRGASSPSA